MSGGHTGRIAFVDLSEGRVSEERLDETMAREYIGGYGLAVRLLFERQKKGADPLGPDNILGFVTGPMTGTRTPTGARYMAVCKSPLTHTWGDANSGGFFGTALKSAGWDAIFVSGISSKPVYLLVTNEGIEIKDAGHLWGKDTVDTEDILTQELGNTKLRFASIGPAAERLSLITGIINDKGRAAGRSGVGAVMGSKKLKAVAVHGTGKVDVADSDTIETMRKQFVEEFKTLGGFAEGLRNYGTCGNTAGAVTIGASPVKNWLLSGRDAFPTVDKVGEGQRIIKYQVRKFACAGCPVACGGIFKVPDGPYPLEETHKIEYETAAAFGPLCLCDDLYALMKLNDMCNRSSLDTISAGAVMAFAMECYDRGAITTSDTDGIELTWGNGEAMVAMLDKMIKREGFGDVLADGIKIAAEKIGKGSEEYAVHVGGQEPGMHNPMLFPGRGTGYVCDPTPGRHTATPMARLDMGPSVSFAPYEELSFDGLEHYDYKNKGPGSATASCFLQVGTCGGVCMFPLVFFGNFRLIEYLNAATGWGMDMGEVLETGARIQTLRLCFNIREGVDPLDIKLHSRMLGEPPMKEGPVADVTVDIDSLSKEYRKAMGWDGDTGHPKDDTVEKLGLKDLVKSYG